MSVDNIAAKLRIDREFADHVAMIRVTHPSVDANGILNKIEVNEPVSAKRIKPDFNICCQN